MAKHFLRNFTHESRRRRRRGVTPVSYAQTVVEYYNRMDTCDESFVLGFGFSMALKFEIYRLIHITLYFYHHTLWSVTVRWRTVCRRNTRSYSTVHQVIPLIMLVYNKNHSAD